MGHSMSAAAFVLAINMIVGAIFSTSFGVVAAYWRNAIGARWLALAYGIGVLSAILEFMLPFQSDGTLVRIAIFTVFLLALTAGVVGLARHYLVDPPWRFLGALMLISIVTNIAIIDMPRESFLRAMLYQLPYAVVHILAVWVILRYPRRRALDRALIVLSGLISLHFLAKPFLAQWIGSGATPQLYLSSTYAAYSQAVGAVLLVANGLLMLLIIVRDVMADMTARSETDALSGLLNRRGFEDRAYKAMALAVRSGVPAVIVVADLDHFKQINDTFGHAAGDGVITAFARVLRDSSNTSAVIGRLGGEEFAIFIAGANLAAGRLYAELTRGAFAGLSLRNFGVTRSVSASFGVAQLAPGDGLSDLLRRADTALYQAKTEGRDRVCVAVHEVDIPVRNQGSGRRALRDK